MIRTHTEATILRVSKYIHSCLLVAKGGDRILFDPGKFTFAENQVLADDFTDLSAIIITHGHPDHCDLDALEAIVKGNPSAVVLTNSEVNWQLTKKGIESEVFESGVRTVGGFEVEAFDATHAPLLGAPTPQNTAYRVDRALLNPGDSFDPRLDALRGTPLLALPVMAPWSKELEVADFVRRLSPKRIIPVHDGYAKAFFLEQRYANFRKLFAAQGIEFESMDDIGDLIEFSPEPQLV